MTGTSTPQQLLANATNDAAEHLRADLIETVAGLTTLDRARIEASIIITNEADQGTTSARVVIVDQNNPIGYFDIYASGTGVASTVYRGTTRDLPRAFVPTDARGSGWAARLLQRTSDDPRSEVGPIFGPSVQDVFRDHPEALEAAQARNRAFLVNRIEAIAQQMIRSVAQHGNGQGWQAALELLGDALG